MKTDPKCPFCVLYQGLKPSEKTSMCFGGFWMKYDIHPVTPGHLLIIPVRKHIVSFFDLPPKEWSELREVVHTARRKVETALYEGRLTLLYKKIAETAQTQNSVTLANRMVEFLEGEPELAGFNFGINDGTAAGQTVGHCHWHLIPRYHGDVKNPVGGIRNVIPAHGDYTRRIR